MSDSEETPARTESGAAAASLSDEDPRKILALHPRDADIVFSSQSSYGGDLAEDFRENVKALSQVYNAVQRYLTGVFRRENVFYPELEDVAKDLQIYKRSISDKMPMPTDEQLFRMCLSLAAQTPPFIHVLRDLVVVGKADLGFVTRFVAPTPKHLDKVIVGYRSTLQTSMGALRSAIARPEFGADYAAAFGGVQKLADVPLQMGRADFVLRRMFIDEKQFPTLSGFDLVNIRKVNQELHKRILRPLIIQASKDRLVTTLLCDDIRAAGWSGADKVFDIVLFSEPRDIKNRYAALTSFLRPEYISQWVTNDEIKALQARVKSNEISQYDYFESLARTLYERLTASSAPPIREIQFAVEVMKLSAHLRGFEKQEARNAENQELRDAVQKIRGAGSLFRLRDHKKLGLNENFLRLMLRGKIPMILALTEPRVEPSEVTPDLDLNQFEHVYLIYKDRKITGKAIDNALELFERSEDAYLLYLIEELLRINETPEAELKEYVAPAYLDKLRFAIRRALGANLPWWSRLWMWLTSSELSDAQVARIRADMRKDRKRKSSKTKTAQTETARKQVRDDVKRLARQRVEESETLAAGAAQSLGEADRSVLERIAEYLNTMWDRGLYPNRDDILNIAPENREAFAKVLGLIDVGAASVREVARIPVAGGNDIYGARAFLTSHRDELIQRCESKLQDEAVPLGEHMELQRKRDVLKRDVFQGLLKYLRQQ